MGIPPMNKHSLSAAKSLKKAHSKLSMGCGNSSNRIDFLIWSGALLPMCPSTPKFPWRFFEVPWSHSHPLEIFWRSRRSRRSLSRSRRSLSRFEEIFKARSRPRSRFISILQDFGRIFLPKSSQNLPQKDSQRIQSRSAVKMLCFY